eukprot:4576406-Pyramimonas_sp.AAC.1
MAAALRAHWKLICAAKAAPSDEIQNYLQCHFPRLPDNQLPLPGIGGVERAARRARPTAAGPDGIPFA